jgi:hypothetical protein
MQKCRFFAQYYSAFCSWTLSGVVNANLLRFNGVVSQSCFRTVVGSQKAYVGFKLAGVVY